MLHSKIDVGSIHKIYNWEVADSTERLALAISSDDVGKVCYQQDTKTLYVLISDSPVEWKEVGSKSFVLDLSPYALIPHGTDEDTMQETLTESGLEDFEVCWVSRTKSQYVTRTVEVPNGTFSKINFYFLVAGQTSNGNIKLKISIKKAYDVSWTDEETDDIAVEEYTTSIDTSSLSVNFSCTEGDLLNLKIEPVAPSSNEVDPFGVFFVRMVFV